MKKLLTITLALVILLSLTGSAFAATLTGRVYRASNGASCAGARVTSQGRTAYTGSSGYYSLNVPSGGYVTVYAYWNGLRGQTSRWIGNYGIYTFNIAVR